MHEKRACQSSGTASQAITAIGRGAQARVERLHQPERLDRLGDVEMRPHRQRVDPGIGAPRGVQRHALAGDRERRFLDRLLARWRRSPAAAAP